LSGVSLYRDRKREGRGEGGKGGRRERERGKGGREGRERERAEGADFRFWIFF